MISVVGKSITLASSLKASSQIASSAKVLAPGLVIKPSTIVVKPETSFATSPSSLIGRLPRSQLKIQSGIGTATQVRFTHHDAQLPDFSHYRHPKTLDPHSKNEDSSDERFSFAYVQTCVGIMGSLYMAKHIVRGAVGALSATDDVLAVSQAEINIGSIPEGKSMTFKWRSKPLFIKHRTEEDIAKEAAVDLSLLRDPETDLSRVNDPKWLVLVGVCTHLGCVPIADAGDYGGYYCPCHGSHYDGSGRIRKGPAPLNLEVPKHTFLTPELILVG